MLARKKPKEKTNSCKSILLERLKAIPQSCFSKSLCSKTIANHSKSRPRVPFSKIQPPATQVQKPLFQATQQVFPHRQEHLPVLCGDGFQHCSAVSLYRVTLGIPIFCGFRNQQNPFVFFTWAFFCDSFREHAGVRGRSFAGFFGNSQASPRKAQKNQSHQHDARNQPKRPKRPKKHL